MLDTSFDIGDWVVVSAKYVRGSDAPDHVVWEKKLLEHPQIVRVTGACRRYDGIQHHSITHYSFDGPEEYESGYLAAEKTHVFYEVRTGWLNKPMLVDTGDMQLCEPTEVREFPLQFARQTCDMEWVAKYMREEMAHWPRDKRGRWIKETKSVTVE